VVVAVVMTSMTVMLAPFHNPMCRTNYTLQEAVRKRGTSRNLSCTLAFFILYHSHYDCLLFSSFC
jgi:hypothetical protein